MFLYNETLTVIDERHTYISSGLLRFSLLFGVMEPTNNTPISLFTSQFLSYGSWYRPGLSEMLALRSLASLLLPPKIPLEQRHDSVTTLL